MLGRAPPARPPSSPLAARPALRWAGGLVAFALMNWLLITSNLTNLVSRRQSSTKSLNSAISISIASSALSEPSAERQYARKMSESSPKCACSRSCTPFSHSGKWCRSTSSSRCHTASHRLCAAACCDGSGSEWRFQLKRSARMSVARCIDASVLSSPSRFLMKATIIAGGVICRSGAYFCSAHRAMASLSSSKSRVVTPSASVIWPAPSSSSDWLAVNAALACAIESFTLWTTRRHRSSPVTSESCGIVHSPTLRPGVKPGCRAGSYL